jgi:putative pyruvate formate lyase activating enzyme
MFVPSYIKLLTSGELEKRIKALYSIAKHCTLCPRKCQVNRLNDEKGYCRAGRKVIISSAGPHYGEEDVLVGFHGSGTIFFANCNLGCIYCQNYEISHYGVGEEVSVHELAEYMLYLQKINCHNVNLVTPTHYVPWIVEAVKVAAERGLSIPIVYNCGGYENVKTIRLLKDIVDIYMPDIKYSDSGMAKKYSDAEDYFLRAKESIKEMHYQVGVLKVDENNIAYRGLLIRHLVLPNGIAGSEEVLKFIAEELSLDTYVNIMDQYRPMFRAYEYKELSRRISVTEYNKVVEKALELGLHRGFSKRMLIY